MKVWRVLKFVLPVLVLMVILSPAVADTSFDIALSWAQKGDLFYSQGQFDQALLAYNTSVSLDPYNSIAWNKLGETQSELGNDADAIHSFTEATRLDPFFGDAWVNRGDALFRTGDDKDALDAYTRAISINPNDMRAYNSKGLLLKSQGKQDDARLAFTEVITISDREIRVHPVDAQYDADMWDYRATALAELGRYQEALQDYDRALTINPKHAGAIRDKRHLLDTLNAEGNISIVKNPPPIPVTTKPTTRPLSLPVIIPLSVLPVIFLWDRFRRKPKT